MYALINCLQYSYSLDIAIGIGIAVASAEVFVEGNAPVGTRSLGATAPSVAGLRTLAVRDGYEAGESENSQALEHHCLLCVGYNGEAKRKSRKMAAVV